MYNNTESMSFEEQIFGLRKVETVNSEKIGTIKVESFSIIHQNVDTDKIEITNSEISDYIKLESLNVTKYDYDNNYAMENIKSEITINVKEESETYDIEAVQSKELNNIEQFIEYRVDESTIEQNAPNDSEVTKSLYIQCKTLENVDNFNGYNANMSFVAGRNASGVFEPIESLTNFNKPTNTNNKKPRMQCPECHKWLSSGNFSAHMRIHSGEKPYQCKSCSRYFRRRDTLNMHMKTHINKNIIECPECKMYFGKKMDFVKHMRIHKDQKPFKCVICQQGYTRYSNLEYHLIKQHKTIVV